MSVLPLDMLDDGKQSYKSEDCVTATVLLTEKLCAFPHNFSVNKTEEQQTILMHFIQEVRDNLC